MRWVVWTLVLTSFVWFLFFVYDLVGKNVQPLVYLAPERAEAAEVVDLEYETVVATITAYTSSVDETDDTPFITASGVSTGRGVIACPEKYKFGTKVEINDTLYTCEDRMNPRYRGQERFDIWVVTKNEAYKWGVRTLKVRVLAQM